MVEWKLDKEIKPSYKKIKCDILQEEFVAGTLTCSGLPREAYSSPAESMICFAGCIICQNVMSSRPWEAAAMRGGRGSQGREASAHVCLGPPRGQPGLLPERLPTCSCCQGLTLTFFLSKGAQSLPAASPPGLRQLLLLQQLHHFPLWKQHGQNMIRVQFLSDDFLLPVCSFSPAGAL